MVKIPGLDDLKKMGSGLLDSAKAVNFGEVMDKLKSGVESVSGKRSGPIPEGDEAMKMLFQEIQTGLNELMQMQATQAAAIKKAQGQLSDLARMITASHNTGADVAAPQQPVQTGQPDQAEVKKHDEET
jgi:hypothetical protein